MLLSSLLRECPLGALCSGCPSTRPQGASLVTPVSASNQGRGLCRGNSLQRAVIGWNQEPRTKATAQMLYREKKKALTCVKNTRKTYIDISNFSKHRFRKGFSLSHSASSSCTLFLLIPALLELFALQSLKLFTV